MPPKRNNTDDDNAGRPSKKPRRGNKPEDQNLEDEPVERSTPDENNVDEKEEDEATIAASDHKNASKFELASGSIDPPELNVKDPSKLTLHFRELATKTEKTLTFHKKPAEEIDWSNNEDILDIQKWRRQLLRRHGFPIERGVTAWLPRERSFIELLFRLLQRRLDAGEQVPAPSNPQIANHLNAFFKGKELEDEKGVRFVHRGNRNANMISTQLRGDTVLGKATKATRDVLKGGKKRVVDWPGITDQQLDRFIADPDVDLQSPNEPLEAGVPEGTAQTGGFDPPNDPYDPIIEPSPIEILGSPDTSTNSPPHGGGAHGPTESPTNIHSSADIEQVRENGWYIPACTKTTNATDVVEGDADTLNDEWMYKAVDALHDRWRRSGTNQFGYHAVIAASRGWQSYFPAEKRQTWYQDANPNAPKTDIMVSTRRPFAQAVNGLLNLAICPPVGYFGDLKSPVVQDVGEWDRFDRAFVHEHQRALESHRGEHEGRLDRYWVTHEKRVDNSK